MTVNDGILFCSIVPIPQFTFTANLLTKIVTVLIVTPQRTEKHLIGFDEAWHGKMVKVYTTYSWYLISVQCLTMLIMGLNLIQ